MNITPEMFEFSFIISGRQQKFFEVVNLIKIFVLFSVQSN